MAKILVKRAGTTDIEEMDIPASKVWDRMAEIIGEGKSATLDRVHLAEPPYSLTMYCDDDGHLKELPLNFKISTNNPFFPIQPIVGTVCFAKGRIVDEDIEYTDITEQDKIIIINLIERGYKL